MKPGQKKNGILLGWPPFAEFKKEMVELMEQVHSPTKEKLNIVENSLLSHIEHTNKEFKTVKNDIHGMKNDISGLKNDISGLKNDISGLKNDVSRIEHHLSNHVTDTNKKIVKLTAETRRINKKMDTQNSQIKKQLKTQNTQINKKLDKLLKK